VTNTETTVAVMNKAVVDITNTVTVITKTTGIIGKDGLQIKSKRDEASREHLIRPVVLLWGFLPKELPLVFLRIRGKEQRTS
jgi:hypothetical protein